MVEKATGNARSTAERSVRPERTSSLRCSKYTILESTDTPIATMRPVTPARVSASPWVSPSQAIIAHSMAPDRPRLAMATRPSRR